MDFTSSQIAFNSEATPLSTMHFDPYFLELSPTASTSHSEAPIVPSSNEKTTKIKRPSNCFMLFRSDYIRAHRLDGHCKKQPELSKKAADVWRSMSDQEKLYYRLFAEETKREHSVRHPDYQFKPERRRKNSGHYRSKKARHPRSVSRATSSASGSGMDNTATYLPSDVAGPPSPVLFDFTTDSFTDPLNDIIFPELFDGSMPDYLASTNYWPSSGNTYLNDGGGGVAPSANAYYWS